MNKVTYKNKEYSEVIMGNGTITLTPCISAFEQALIDMKPQQSICFKSNSYSTNQEMLIKHGNGTFTYLWKGSSGKWRINATSDRVLDNMTIDELRQHISFDHVVSFSV